VKRRSYMNSETKIVNGTEYHKEIDSEGREMWFSEWKTSGYDTYPNAVPEGCTACGGDYPNCASSCPLFD